MMVRCLFAAVLGLGLVGCASLAAPPARAQGDVPSVLVMAEDYDRDAVARNSRVTRQVLDEIQSALNDEGYTMLDETAVGLGYLAEDRVRRPRSELLQVALAAARRPQGARSIDAVVLFTVYASAKSQDFLRTGKLRLEAIMLDPRSGQTFGNAQTPAGADVLLPQDCSQECMMEAFAEEARRQGRDLGRTLALKLKDFWRTGQAQAAAPSGGGDVALAPSTDTGVEPGFERVYGVCFDGFTQDELLDAEEYLRVFQGYASHKVTTAAPTRTCYEYRSSIAQSRLNRNLVRMLEHVGYRGQVYAQGTDFTVERVRERRQHPLDPRDWTGR